MTDNDFLRPRLRPGGLRVEAEAATWESTVFAISIGLSVRYLEVPAEQVGAFLAAVDAGQFDEELAGIARTSTGASKERPGRVRAIAAFDRVLRTALSRAERDPGTGQLGDPGSREHKRQRDDNQSSRHDRSQSSHSQAGAGQPVAAGAGAGAGAAAVTAAVAGPSVGAVGSSVAAVAARSWWSSPIVAVGAVVAVVVVAAGAVFALTRPADEPVTTVAVAVSSSAESVAPPAVSGDTSSAGAAVSSGPASSAVTSAPTSVPSAAVSSAVSSEPVASAAASAAPVGSVPAAPAPGAPGSNNQFAGTYTFTRTVTENTGNTDFPIGTTESGSLTLTAACDEPTCAIDGERFGVPTVSGNQLAFAGTAPAPCPVDPGITTQLAFTVTVTAADPTPVDGVPRVGAMQGVGTLTVSDLAGCTSEVRPITYSYDLTRTG